MPIYASLALMEIFIFFSLLLTPHHHVNRRISPPSSMIIKNIYFYTYTLISVYIYTWIKFRTPLLHLFENAKKVNPLKS